MRLTIYSASLDSSFWFRVVNGTGQRTAKDVILSKCVVGAFSINIDPKYAEHPHALHTMDCYEDQQTYARISKN